MKVNLYSPKSKKVETLVLPKEYASELNEPLLAQALHVYRSRLHPGTSKTKTRSEVNLTKAKAWRQKGTGRARHGAKSAPIFVGGGVAHGPKGIKRILEMPKKMKQKALVVALTLKAKEGEIAAVSDISVINKTSDAQKLVETIREGEKMTAKKRIMFALADKNSGFSGFANNLNGVGTIRYKDLNAYAVYVSGRLVIDSDALKDKIKKEAKE